MDSKVQTQRSKFLSLVLRHQPEIIGIRLNEGGWVPVGELLEALLKAGRSLGREELNEIVATSPKQRFAFSPDGSMIRANQGHSVEVALGLEAQPPPELLYHGTVATAIRSILREGLNKQQRHHVHLSADIETAKQVGSRRGAPVVLEIDAKRMHAAGHIFYRSENGVWLTDAVPAEFLRQQ
jgi:putative RNA 2'-phosphotransferase